MQKKIKLNKLEIKKEMREEKFKIVQRVQKINTKMKNI